MLDDIRKINHVMKKISPWYEEIIGGLKISTKVKKEYLIDC